MASGFTLSVLQFCSNVNVVVDFKTCVFEICAVDFIVL
jgi:hypothetical protein